MFRGDNSQKLPRDARDDTTGWRWLMGMQPRASYLRVDQLIPLSHRRPDRMTLSKAQAVRSDLSSSCFHLFLSCVPAETRSVYLQYYVHYLQYFIVHELLRNRSD